MTNNASVTPNSARADAPTNSRNRVRKAVPPATQRRLKVYESTGVGAIAVEEVPSDTTNLYCIVDGEPAPQPPFGERLRRIRDLVETPKPENAPSNLAITGPYVLPAAVFDCL